MSKIYKYLDNLEADKEVLVDNLVEKGVEATDDETFTTLVAKVATINTEQGKVETDNLTINKNSEDKIQAIGVIDVNTGNVDRFWTGTLAEYNAIETKDTGTIYYITDEEDTPATQEYVDTAIQEALGTIESELGGI